MRKIPYSFESGIFLQYWEVDNFKDTEDQSVLKRRWVMRRVDFMIGARDFKALKAEQFMQYAVNFYDVNDTGE